MLSNENNRTGCFWTTIKDLTISFKIENDQMLEMCKACVVLISDQIKSNDCNSARESYTFVGLTKHLISIKKRITIAIHVE